MLPVGASKISKKGLSNSPLLLIWSAPVRLLCMEDVSKYANKPAMTDQTGQNLLAVPAAVFYLTYVTYIYKT